MNWETQKIDKARTLKVKEGFSTLAKWPIFKFIAESQPHAPHHSRILISGVNP